MERDHFLRGTEYVHGESGIVWGLSMDYSKSEAVNAKPIEGVS